MKTLELKYSISKARDTYGDNIVTLIDECKKYRTLGGGYDMIGTVFAQWLKDHYYDELFQLAQDEIKRKEEYYGLFVSDDKAKIWLDGCCGFECIKKIAKAIGLEVQTIWKKNHGYTYILVGAKNDK